MTISYPLTLPSNDAAPKRITFFAIESVALSRSPYTFATQVQEHQGSAWSAEVTLPPMARADAEEWIAFLLSLRGQRGTFYLRDPLGITPRGSASGTPLVNGGGQTGNVLSTDGWSTSVNGVLLAGDYIQLGTRLYKVLEDVNADGSGEADITIWPSLRESPADNDTVITTDCKGLFRLSSNVNQIWNAEETRLYGASFTAVEAL